ncbi:MAG: UDP-N-acetylglucosamine 4,6-dehydratase, partial [Candidatus Nealsonbacteria bacterium CG_4_8_14_3_um_filter_37_23]
MIKKRTLFFLIGDIILISLAVFLAFLLRFEWEIPGEHLLNLAGMIILALIFCPPVFYGLKLYAFSWSYVSASELVSLFKAVLLSFLFLAAALFLFRDSPIFLGFPRSTFFISFFLVFLFTG